MQYLIQRIFVLVMVVYLVGCSYTQPKTSEPHGIIYPTGALRVVKVDGEALRNFSFQKTAIRVAPGSHILTLKYGQTEKPAVGSKSPYTEYPLEVEADKSYYLKAKINYKINNVGLGIKFRQIESWEPIMIDKEAAQDIEKEEATQEEENTTKEESGKKSE